MTRQSRRRPWRVQWFDHRWDQNISRAYGDEKGARELAQRVADDGATTVLIWRVDNGGYVDGAVERVVPSA